MARFPILNPSLYQSAIGLMDHGIKLPLPMPPPLIISDAPSLSPVIFLPSALTLQILGAIQMPELLMYIGSRLMVPLPILLKSPHRMPLPPIISDAPFPSPVIFLPLVLTQQIRGVSQTRGPLTYTGSRPMVPLPILLKSLRPMPPPTIISDTSFLSPVIFSPLGLTK